MTSTTIGGCVQRAPSPQAGIILYIAVREHETNPTKYSGDSWASMSVDEWLNKTGLKPDQFKHALRRMSDAKLIKRKFRRHPSALLLRPLLEVKISTSTQPISQPAPYDFQ
jgi:hypothetical protein